MRRAALYSGGLLPADRYAEWALAPRERLRRTYLELRRTYLELLRAAELWERLAAEEPADEQAHREPMGGDMESGDADGAVRRFRRLTAVLAELGLRPGPATVAVYEDAVRGGSPARPLHDAARRAADHCGGAAGAGGASRSRGRTRRCRAMVGRSRPPCTAR